MSLADRVKPFIRSLAPYVPGKPIEELERELGITGSIKLASNENPLGPSPRAVEAMRRAAAEIHRYPDGASFALREALSKKLGVTGDQLVFGAGADEILELIAKTLMDEGDDPASLICGAISGLCRFLGKAERRYIDRDRSIAGFRQRG